MSDHSVSASERSLETLAGGLSKWVNSPHTLTDSRQRARAKGLFAQNRQPLECADCGLYEDMDIYGYLYTNHRYLDIPYPDTGLRFEEVEPGRFCCPVCGNLLMRSEGVWPE